MGLKEYILQNLGNDLMADSVGQGKNSIPDCLTENRVDAHRWFITVKDENDEN